MFPDVEAANDLLTLQNFVRTLGGLVAAGDGGRST